MQQDEILIKSQKNQFYFDKFKKKMLIIGAIAVPYALFPCLIGVKEILPLFIGLSLLWLCIVAFIYFLNRYCFNNIEWIVTQKGITLLNKKTKNKTFIATDHINSVFLVKNCVRIISNDITRPVALDFLENATEMVETIKSLIYTTKKHKEVTISQSKPAEEIVKYKKLYDDGIITKEEFEQKKKQLLNI